jgi:hypothetical protein
MDNEKLQQKIQELENKIQSLEANYAKHQHDGIDGTNTLRKSIKLDRDQFLNVGLGTQATGETLAGGQLQYAISVGNDDGRSGFVKKADILQLDLLHQPSALSFLTARRTPLVNSLSSTSLSTTSGGNTVTIAGYNFVTDELANAIINIYNSSGTFIETRTIASNTATVITINGTWGATTSSATFNIYKPVYLGSAEWVFQRAYVQEGTAGGVRFGDGVTDGALDQNGLLYMDATGDLYWRPKTGAAVKLN